MFEGSLYVTTDYDLIMNLPPTHLVICVSGDLDMCTHIRNTRGAEITSVLLPPPDVSMIELDGSIEMFRGVYYEYLSQKEPFEFMSIILRALYNGKNVVFYLTKDEYQLSYMKVLIEYFQVMFGIYIGTELREFAIDPNFIPIIFNILLMSENNLMSLEEYIMGLPQNIRIENPMIIERLMTMLNVRLQDMSLPSCIEYINNYRSKSIKAQKPLIIPLGVDYDAISRRY